jgi:hypothetical protein
MRAARALAFALLLTGSTMAAPAAGKASGTFTVGEEKTKLSHAWVLEKNALLSIVVSAAKLDDPGAIPEDAIALVVQLDESRQAAEVFFHHPELPAGLSVRELSRFESKKSPKGTLAGTIRFNDPGFSFGYTASFEAPITRIEDTVPPLPADASPAEHALWRLKQLGVSYDQSNYRDRIMRGDADVVKLFLDAGMPVNSQDALNEAVEFGHPAVVKVLLAAGADHARVGPYGSTTLMKAVDIGNLEVLQALIDSGADVNAVNEWKIGPLSTAAEQGKLEIVKALLAAGANVNARDTSGGTALSIAVMRGYKEVVETLLAAGADVKRDRESLLEYAADKPEIRAIIEKALARK